MWFDMTEERAQNNTDRDKLGRTKKKKQKKRWGGVSKRHEG